MNIPIDAFCPELEHVESPPCPQTHLDMAALEYRKAQLGQEQWRRHCEARWRVFIYLLLLRSKN